MEIDRKLQALDQIYAVYEEFSAQWDLACHPGCCHCCTTKVTLTTLEAYKVIDTLSVAKQIQLLEKIERIPPEHRFRPTITSNQLAAMCARGDNPAPEEPEVEVESCPLLNETLCSIYGIRPFGCRCFVSRRDCGQTGFADVEEFILSVNTVFLQTIEHLDAQGCTGNLINLLNFMSLEPNRKAYQSSNLSCHAAGFISNHPLSVLMIPPEHRRGMGTILQKLRSIRL
jgi:Fe-S-cluster containining protein